ncbi:unnamed protein product [Lathyrus sativus]|nr:unnamed protein product [Lathyrus sativus]
MFGVFKDYGLILEVYIPAMMDKRGMRYGFIRFRKVIDARIMAVKLNSIQILGKKIYADIQRFKCGRDTVKPNAVNSGLVGRKGDKKHTKGWNNKAHGKSFAYVVGNKQAGDDVRVGRAEKPSFSLL